MLKLWAEEMHAPGIGGGGFGGGNMIAMLMATKGELIRGTRGSRVLLDQAAEIELIVNQMEEILRQVVIEHYLNEDSSPRQKYEFCRCSQKAYYARLHVAHLTIQSRLMRRAA